MYISKLFVYFTVAANGLQYLSLSGNRLGSTGIQHVLECLPCTSLVWLCLNNINLEIRDNNVIRMLKDYLLKVKFCVLIVNYFLL